MWSVSDFFSLISFRCLMVQSLIQVEYNTVGPEEKAAGQSRMQFKPLEASLALLSQSSGWMDILLCPWVCVSISSIDCTSLIRRRAILFTDYHGGSHLFQTLCMPMSQPIILSGISQDYCPHRTLLSNYRDHLAVFLPRIMFTVAITPP